MNASRGAIAAGLSHLDRAGEITKDYGAKMAMVHTLRQRVTSNARASDQDVGPTITAALDDGPLQGRHLEAPVVEGRPPSTVDVPADDGSTYRYCLADWVQGGTSAVYTFLYRV